jgi:phage shock protein PspC (stress-responsive transcriptional regulator)
MGIADDLERLAELHRSGALSDAEFASAKARALGSRLHGTDPLVDGLNRLRRSRSDRWLGGVCGGLAPATGLPSWLWRLIFVVLVACAGTGLVAYVLLWILLPKEAASLDLDAGSLRST